MSKPAAKAAPAKDKKNVDLQSSDEQPAYARGQKPKNIQQLNDFEKHVGWGQICAKEKYGMISSIKRSMAENETYDHNRAGRLLKAQEDQISESAFGQSHTRDFLPKLNAHKPIEIPFVDQVAIGRNQMYMEPVDVFDPTHPIRGKKRFNDNFRPVRAKIDLKQKLEQGQKKVKEKMNVKQSLLDEFDKVYAENCDQYLTRLRHRNVSYDSPFDVRNAPPQAYLDALKADEDKVAKRPNQINLNDFVGSTRKDASGKMTGLGTQIIDLGPVKAKLIVTYPWNAKQFDTTGMKEAKFQNEYLRKKREQVIAGKLTNQKLDDHESYIKGVERHTNLHQKVHVQPLTGRSNNVSPSPMAQHTRDTIMDASRRSPVSCRMTDDRVNMLIAAKQKRSERKRNPSMQIQTVNSIGKHKSLMVDDMESRFASTTRVN